LEAQSQANKTLLLILLVYLMCALPFTVLMTYSLFEPEIDGLAGGKKRLLNSKNKEKMGEG